MNEGQMVWLIIGIGFETFAYFVLSIANRDGVNFLGILCTPVFTGCALFFLWIASGESILNFPFNFWQGCLILFAPYAYYIIRFFKEYLKTKNQQMEEKNWKSSSPGSSVLECHFRNT